jgi:hypothetical protein
MSAAAIPARAYGKTTPRTTSQRVAPRASAPSFSSAGTLTKSSRQILETIGMIMIVRIRIAANMFDPTVGLVLKMGTQPRVPWIAGPSVPVMKGPSTRIPQSPSTTLGIAASSSTSGATTERIQGGASSLRKSAIAKARSASRGAGLPTT